MAHPSIILTSEFEVPGGNNYGNYIRYMTRQGVLEAKGDNLTSVERNELDRINKAIAELESDKKKEIKKSSHFEKEVTDIEAEAMELLKHDIFSDVEQSEDFSNYISYMGRTNALKSKEKLNPDELEQLDYMETKASEFMGKIKDQTKSKMPKEQSLSTGLFTLDKNDLTAREEQEMAKKFSKASKKGSILYKDVISFDTAALIKEGIYNPETKELDREPLIAAGRKMMKKFFDNESLNETGIWTGMIHYNTNHFHIHFAATELENTRKSMVIKNDGKEIIQPRGKRKLSVIDSMKSDFANDIFRRREVQERRSELRNTLVQEIKTELNNDTIEPHKALVYDIYCGLPANRKDWNYKRLKPATKEKLDQLVTKLMKENPNFEDYQNLLREESAFRKTLYGETKRNDKDYFKNQSEDIQKRLGNSFLKELKSCEIELNKVNNIVFESKLAINERRKEARIALEERKKEAQKFLLDLEENTENSTNAKMNDKEIDSPIKEEEFPRESNLGKYSTFNQSKIKSQFPEATFVQGKYSWVKEGRKLKSDALPIEVSSPVFELDESGEPTKKVIYFETIQIYDISQTEKRVVDQKHIEGRKGSFVPENEMGSIKEEKELPRESNLGKYSKFNQSKIKNQFPEATFVQGEYSWVKEGRKLKSDALPIEISSPVFELDATGEPTKRVIHFETIQIYDISQTEKRSIDQNHPEGRKGSFVPENGKESMKNGKTKSYDYSLFTDGTYQTYTYEQQQLYYARLLSSKEIEKKASYESEKPFFVSHKTVNNLKQAVNNEYEDYKNERAFAQTQRKVEQAKKQQAYDR
ncbi:relaxase MobL [Carnobacterium divergens]|uniref:Relaxase MobL n=1 Tax=Carnobacterium divergens TaxID=2748 RepID=A0AAW8RBU9_CARDV|nr:MobP2 family relaxase [Carnobacterium divergens]MDT1958984.1 relaxase MobL [Carnobacterium divergens]MDT1974952.1 relaxase MobL [Carnobacterium divergens]